MKEQIESIAKSIGWKELYPHTVERIEYFTDQLYNCIEKKSPGLIAKSEVCKEVTMNLAIYGQEEIYNIYRIAKDHLTKNDSLEESFLSFCQGFDEAVGVKFESNIKTLIYYVFEFMFAWHIKGGNPIKLKIENESQSTQN